MMLRSQVTRYLGRTAPLTQRLVAPSFSAPIRAYSTEPKKDDDEAKNEKKVNFRSFVTVGIFASILLTQVVEVVNKEKPRPRSMSETEYYQQQARLKRKVALFTPEEKEVYLLKGAEKIEKSQVHVPEGVDVIYPDDLVELEKKNEESKFHALLNDPSTTTLPRGLIVDLVGQYLSTKPNGKFLVLNFPPDLKEAIKFEEKVVTIKSLLNATGSEEEQVIRYYKTVDKVKTVESLDKLEL